MVPTFTPPYLPLHYSQLRAPWLPASPTLIIIAESPPESGLYFYDEAGSPREPLFSAVMDSIVRIDPPATKSEGLAAMQAAGCVLLDATYVPVNSLSEAGRKRFILEGFEELCARIDALAPDKNVPILLVKANVCELLEPLLTARGYTVLNKGRSVAFPSHGNQPKFRGAVREILSSFDTGAKTEEGPPMVFCADIGSVANHNFAWACSRQEQVGHPQLNADIGALADAVATALMKGKVALGFECPLFVPLPDDPAGLTKAREGEGNRAWSAGAGAGALATGLTETVWLLQCIRDQLPKRIPAYLDWQSFTRAREGLFVWEAFVSGDGKRGTHQADAQAAVRAFMRAYPQIDSSNAIRPARVRSLIGAALLQAGWSTELQLLSRPCLVIKV